jgi:glyoxylase-like metal-dependent hydrolase (beta-lactamase superfamily II)
MSSTIRAKPTRLKVIECGRTSLDYEMAVTGHPDYLMRQSALDEAARHRWLHHPIYAFIVEHPDGNVLVDTGVNSDFARRWRHPYYPDVMAYEPGPDGLFIQRLEQTGLGVEDFRYVVLTHLHTDHAGNAAMFRDAGAHILVHEDEIRGAITTKGSLLRDDDITLWGASSPQGFVRQEFGFLVPDRATTVYADQEIVRGVWVVSLPGHTWGTVGVAVDLPGTGWVLLASDAMYLSDNYRHPFLPSMLNHNPDLWARSAVKIRRLAEQYEMLIVPGHDDHVIEHPHDRTGTVVDILPEYV